MAGCIREAQLIIINNEFRPRKSERAFGVFRKTRILKRIYAYALTALLTLVGCTREEFQPSFGTLTLRASVASEVASKVTAAIDEDTKLVSFLWSHGDEIAVRTSTGFESLSLVGGGGSDVAEFTGSPAGSLEDCAVYPSEVAQSLEGGSLTVSLPAEYVYTPDNTHALMCAVIKGEWMHFQHLAALLRIDAVDVPAGATLVVSTPERKINGMFSVNYQYKGSQIVTSSPQDVTQSEVIVTFAETVSLARVYLPMPVGEYPELNIKILDKNGKLIEGSERTTTAPKKFVRGGLKVMPKIEMRLPSLTIPSDAYRMETVKVEYGNVLEGQEVTIDFGDGTYPLKLSGSGSVEHAFDNDSGVDKIYTVCLKTDGQEVEKQIKICPLMALSAAARLFKDPTNTDVWVMAHRSNTSNKAIPENSISAVKAAIAAGVDIVEIDTQLTSDGHVVVCHDQTINRTTTGTGDITALKLSKIKNYKLKDRNGKTTSESMPTLQEILEVARGKVYVNLDYSPRTASTADVMKVVEDLGMVEQVLFYCNEAEKIDEVIALNPKAHPYTWYSNYQSLTNLDGNYFVQYSYVPDSAPNLGAAVAEGMICTVNMLTDVSDISIDSGQLNQLFGWFPFVRVIHADASDKLVAALSGFTYTPAVTDYFVTPSGSGSKNGRDWGNAMGMSELRTLLRTNTADNGALLDGVTFHCAAGKYITIDDADSKRLKVCFSKYGAPVDICFKGGYSPASTGKDLTKRNVVAYESRFTGDYNDNGVTDEEDMGIMCLDAYSFLTFDGFTFSNAFGNGRWRQGAFVMNADKGKLSLVLNNCRFTDLNTCQSVNDGRGAALFVLNNTSVRAKSVIFENCCSYGPGGAISIDGATSSVCLEDCSFTGCASSNSNGGAISMNAGVLDATECTFDGCDAVQGGSLSVSGTGPVSRFNACEFKNCVANDRGGAIVQSPPSVLFMNACSMHNNMILTRWGSAIAAKGSLLMNNCTISHNSGEGAAVNGNGNWVVLNSTIVNDYPSLNSERNAALRCESTPESRSFIINSIVFYSSSSENCGGIHVTDPKYMLKSSGYNRYDKATNFSALPTDISGQTTSSLNLTWNAGYYSWSGPKAVQPKATLKAVESELKTGCPIAVGPYTDIGHAFYDWLQEIGDGKNPLAYDQLGNARNTSAMWPGAYEK